MYDKAKVKLFVCSFLQKPSGRYLHRPRHSSVRSCFLSASLCGSRLHYSFEIPQYLTLNSYENLMSHISKPYFSSLFGPWSVSTCMLYYSQYKSAVLGIYDIIVVLIGLQMRCSLLYQSYSHMIFLLNSTKTAYCQK